MKAVIKLPIKKHCHMHYVTFSRVKNTRGLHILGKENIDKICVSPAVTNEMQCLEIEKQVKLCYYLL